MLAEAREAPAARVAPARARRAGLRDFGALLREQSPTSLLTVARGSSDHAAHFMAYLIMARMGRLCTSLPMSLITLYQSQIVCDGLVSLAFSQSGQSPDLVAPTRFFSDGGARHGGLRQRRAVAARQGGAMGVPAARRRRGSVAATKSFIAQLVAGARLVAAWKDDVVLAGRRCRRCRACWRARRATTGRPRSMRLRCRPLFVIGRGTGLAIALEAALKFKETCAIQAEAFLRAPKSARPMALSTKGYPLLVFAPRGPARPGLLTLADEMRARGRTRAARRAGRHAGQPARDRREHVDRARPDRAIQSFYPMVEALARLRGFDPDKPRHLAKVTRTH
jgi:glucosamine--fructose-6-phosphate aminotransferase (isomerizing)